MKTRLIAAGLAVAVVLVVVLLNATGGTEPCATGLVPACVATDSPSPTNQPTDGSSPSSSQPIISPGTSPLPSVEPTPEPTAAVYTFRDEFSGKTLKDVWGRHWDGFGTTIFSRSQVTVGNGVLTIKARRSGAKYVGGLIDTVGTWTQKYGFFSARMKIVEGNGLWPAFWLAQPQNAKREQAEIDVMEVCANNVGVRDGNDVTLLHHYVHKIDGSHAFALGYRTANLAGEWHTYAVDWRADHVTFYFDGVETTTFTFASDTDVSDMKMAIVLDLAVGGRFCGPTDATTPAVATIQVDWVRASR
jgi:beta-glucanase (GH16 family)